MCKRQINKRPVAPKPSNDNVPKPAARFSAQQRLSFRSGILPVGSYPARLRGRWSGDDPRAEFTGPKRGVPVVSAGARRLPAVAATRPVLVT
jgi:hypothetical protein